MDVFFDLNEIQVNILSRCPEWQDMLSVVSFKNTPEADPVRYADSVIYYNSRKMRRFPQEVQAYLIAQQLMHIQLAHRQRRNGRNRKIWEAACNIIVNELLIADGFETTGMIPRMTEARNMSAESLYEVLYEEMKDNDPEFEEDDHSEEEAEVDIVISPQNKEKDWQAGDLQGAQEREIEDENLAQAVAGLSDLIEPSMQFDYDWFPADRIRDGMLLHQFKPYPVPHAEILLDTSASIEADLLRAFVRGVRELLREDAVIRVGCFDTEFYGFQEIRSEKDIEKLEIIGSGGTDFETAVRAFSGDAETKIIFTDGYAAAPEMRCDAIWLVYSDMSIDPPGGRVIYVEKPQETDKNEIDFLIT